MTTTFNSEDSRTSIAVAGGIFRRFALKKCNPSCPGYKCRNGMLVGLLVAESGICKSLQPTGDEECILVCFNSSNQSWDKHDFRCILLAKDVIY